MIFLSKSALQYAVSKCREENNYKIVIVPYEYQDNLYISNILGEYLSGIPDYTVRKMQSDFQIWFNNGSVIRIVPARESSHGIRCNLIIADKQIPSDILSTVFKPMEVLDYVRINKDGHK